MNGVNCGNHNCESCFPKDDGTPKYKGCFTPDQVRKMMREMDQFLKDTNELSEYSTKICEHDWITVGDFDIPSRHCKKCHKFEQNYATICCCENHPHKRATSVNASFNPPKYYCEECWEKLHAPV